MELQIPHPHLECDNDTIGKTYLKRRDDLC